MLGALELTPELELLEDGGGLAALFPEEEPDEVPDTEAGEEEAEGGEEGEGELEPPRTAHLRTLDPAAVAGENTVESVTRVVRAKDSRMMWSVGVKEREVFEEEGKTEMEMEVEVKVKVKEERKGKKEGWIQQGWVLEGG